MAKLAVTSYDTAAAGAGAHAAAAPEAPHTTRAGPASGLDVVGEARGWLGLRSEAGPVLAAEAATATASCLPCHGLLDGAMAGALPARLDLDPAAAAHGGGGGVAATAVAFKVAVLGASASGKSALVSALLGERPAAAHAATAGVQVRSGAWRVTTAAGRPLSMRVAFWESSTRELARHRHLKRALLRGADAALLLCSLADAAPLDALDDLLREAEGDCAGEDAARRPALLVVFTKWRSDASTRAAALRDAAAWAARRGLRAHFFAGGGGGGGTGGAGASPQAGGGAARDAGVRDALLWIADALLVRRRDARE